MFHQLILMSTFGDVLFWLESLGRTAATKINFSKTQTSEIYYLQKETHIKCPLFTTKIKQQGYQELAVLRLQLM